MLSASRLREAVLAAERPLSGHWRDPLRKQQANPVSTWVEKSQFGTLLMSTVPPAVFAAAPPIEIHTSQRGLGS
jgi:hypothetical protein